MKTRSSNTLQSVLALATLALAALAKAQVTFYEHDGFTGCTFTTQRAVESFERTGFNDRASSVAVLGSPCDVCENAAYAGRCTVLREGQHPSLSAMGLNDRASSVRAVSRHARFEEERYAPPAPPAYDNRRRGDERLYQAKVASVRAVVGTPAQRCWFEQQPVAQQPNGNASVPGALIGAVLGGARPGYWDVSCIFRGQEHRMQMTTAPGPTVTVNRRGEPRA